MSRLLHSPKALTALIVSAVILVISLAGGALGNEFGGGFIGSPLAHIQLPAESITAKPIFSNFYITNTMIASWISIAVLVVVSLFATRQMSDVPRGIQNLIEVVIEFFLNLCESVAGRDKARRFLPLVMTIFLFIVTSNWLGILPGFGTIGRFESSEEVIHHAEDHIDEGMEVDLSTIKLQIFEINGPFALMPLGSVNNETTADNLDEDTLKDNGEQAGLLVPFLRSANTDINTTLAIALVAMFMVHFWAFRTLGFFSHIGKFLNFKGGPIGLFVGVLEGISEIARVISFTFRLFGNIFAGEVLLIAMIFLVPLVGIIPFLGLELFVGLIQAFIFSMLTLVFASMATVSHKPAGH